MSESTIQQKEEAIKAFNAGVRAMQSGNTAAAVDSWERAVSHYRATVPAIRNLIVHFEQTGNWTRVANLYGELLAIDPFDTNALVRQATALRKRGELSSAITNYRRAISVYPYFRFWYEDVASILEEIGNVADANAWRERGAMLDADAAEMAYEDGQKQVRAKNFELAAAIFEAVVDEFPGNVEARMALADALFHAGRPDDALRQVDAAMQSPEKIPALIHFRRGLLYRDWGKLEESEAELKLALQHEPSYGRAQIVLEDVRRRIEARSVPSVPPVPVPALPAPNRAHHWTRQLFEALFQASNAAVSAGKTARVAVLLESEPQLLPICRKVLEIMRSADLRLSNAVYVVEAEPRQSSATHGSIAEGWLGSELYPTVDFSKWSAPSVGMPIDRALDCAGNMGGPEGFCAVVIVSTGRVREDQTATLGIVRHFPTMQMLLVKPTTSQPQLSLRMSGVAPNWAEIVAV